MNSLRKLLILTFLAGISLVLFLFDSLIPHPIPGGKIGFSQLVTLFLLYRFGWREAFVVLLLRLLTGNLILGTLFAPVFFLSTGGGLISLMLMGLLRQKKWFSCIGISVLGAFGHNVAQIWIAYLVLVRHPGIFYWLPYFTLVAIFSGALIGLMTTLLLARTDKLFTRWLPTD